jgi:hypothetical protein
MELTGEGVSVYTEAKSEYTKQLCQYMLPALQQYFLDMLEEAKGKETNPNKLLLAFQGLLETVPEWNVDKVQRETSSLASGTRCDYLEELLTAVFIAHTKVLSAIRLTTRQKKLQITIPRLEHFLHRTLTECSRLLWSNTFLFSLSVPSIERQKNLRQIESILQSGIQQAIRSMLPVKNILREYLKEDGGGDEEEEEEKEEADIEEENEQEQEEEEKKEKQAEEKRAAEVAEEKRAAEVAEEKRAAEVAEEKRAAEVAEEKRAAEEKKYTPPITFTGLDTNNTVPEKQPEADSEEVTILDGSPEPMDGFEDLENKEETLQMDFEELL